MNHGMDSNFGQILKKNLQHCYDSLAIKAADTSFFVSTNHGGTSHVTSVILTESYPDVWPPDICISQQF